MLEKIKEGLCYGGMTPQEFHIILGESIKTNYRSLRVYSVLFVLFLMFMSFLDLFVAREMDSNQKYYWLAIVNIAIIYTITRFVHDDDHHKVDFLSYIFLINLYGMGLMIMCAHLEYPTVVLMALLVVLPLLFVMMPYKIMIMTLVVGTLCMISACVFEKGSVMKIDIYYTICFTMISLIEDYISNVMRMHSLMAHYEVKYLSERDLLTKLYNRNKYEEVRDTFPSLAKERVTLVYGDANGLHEINNTQGHGAGDEMLKGVARTMEELLGNHVFRIGGDEFIAVLLDYDDCLIDEQIAKANKQLQEKGYSVSFGYVSMGKEDQSMKALEKEAEALMYKKKQIYYQDVTHDRRHMRR